MSLFRRFAGLKQVKTERFFLFLCRQLCIFMIFYKFRSHSEYFFKKISFLKITGNRIFLYKKNYQ